MITGLFTLTNIIYATLFLFVFYPVVGGMFWIIGGAYYHFRTKNQLPKFPEDAEEPCVSIMVPCHNEEISIENTLKYLDTQIDYTNYEIIAISDGSTDRTNEILKEWQTHSNRLRVIEVEKNKGKAHALDLAVLHAKGDYVLCIDADSFVAGDAIKKMVAWFMVDSMFSPAKMVGAVTGNPTPRNRTTLLGKLQFVEYNSIIGIIKRAQSVIGRIFTVSGVCAMYRKEALIDVGFFDQEKITEDIAISWKLQLNNWRVQYCPSAWCYMEVPEDLGTLYKQRRRWAQGGVEVFLSHATDILFHPIKTFPFIFLFLDQFISILWAIFWLVSTLFVIFYVIYCLSIGDMWNIKRLFISSCIFIMYEFVVGVVQLISSMVFNDSQKGTLKYIFFAGWYTWLYWLVSPITLLASLPRAVKAQITGGGGTWTSPERKEEHH
jgi:biofilm PGA synthesis N-glycosyltransferase PgaC